MSKASPSFRKPITAKNLAGRVALFLCTTIGLFLVSAVVAPQVLAWPYQAQFGSSTVYAEAPIPPQLTATMAKADALTRGSAIYNEDGYPTDIFLSDGGWRWRLASLGAATDFALTRPVGNAIVVNNSDMTAGTVNAARTLSSIIAHERTHGLIRNHFGRVRAAFLQRRKIEGYCDYVAQESTLSDADYTRLKQAGKTRTAMLYYEGRKQAQQALDVEKIGVNAFFSDE